MIRAKSPAPSSHLRAIIGVRIWPSWHNGQGDKRRPARYANSLSGLSTGLPGHLSMPSG